MEVSVLRTQDHQRVPDEHLVDVLNASCLFKQLIGHLIESLF